MRLPVAHRGLLAATNGVEAGGNYLRLFGAGRGSLYDLAEWNSLELWKFAWTDEVHDCLLFAQDGAGEQVGYRMADVRPGRPEPPVVSVSLDDPRPRPLHASFEAFMSQWAEQAEAYSAAPPVAGLGPNEVLVHTPSRLIASSLDESEVLRMDAVAAMVVSGDVWTQIAQAELGAAVDHLQPYIDQNGRARIRLVWA